MTRRDKWTLAAILTAALLVRLAVLWACRDLNTVVGDGVRHFDESVNIVNGYPYAGRRAPGYSAMLAAAQFMLPGEPIRACQAANVFLGLLTVLGVYGAGLSIHGRRVGEIAAAVVALDPRYVTHCVFPMPENGYVPLVVFSLLFVMWGMKKPGIALGLLTGVTLGLTTLVRSMMLYFVPPILGVLVLFGARRWRGNVLQAVAVAVGLVATVAPWTIRNYRTYHRFVIVSYDDGGPLAYGNLKPETGPKDHVKSIRKELGEEIRSNVSSGDQAAAVDVNNALRAEALKAIRSDIPGWMVMKFTRYAPKLLEPGRYFLEFVQEEDQDGQGIGTQWARPLTWFFVATQVVVLLLAPFGLGRSRLHLVNMVLVLYVLYSFFVHLVVHMELLRYQLPYLWIFVLWAALAIVDRPQWNVRRVAVTTALFGLVASSLGWSLYRVDWEGKAAAKAARLQEAAQIVGLSERPNPSPAGGGADLNDAPEGMTENQKLIWTALHSRALTIREVAKAVKDRWNKILTPDMIQQDVRAMKTAGYEIGRIAANKLAGQPMPQLYRPDAPPPDHGTQPSADALDQPRRLIWDELEGKALSLTELKRILTDEMGEKPTKEVILLYIEDLNRRGFVIARIPASEFGTGGAPGYFRPDAPPDPAPTPP